MCHTPCPLHPLWFDPPTNIWHDIQLMKPLTVLLCPASCYFPPLDPNILLTISFSDTLHLCSCFNAQGQVSHPSNTTNKIMVLYILISMFVHSKRKGRRLWTKWLQVLPNFMYSGCSMVVSSKILSSMHGWSVETTNSEEETASNLPGCEQGMNVVYYRQCARNAHDRVQGDTTWSGPVGNVHRTCTFPKTGEAWKGAFSLSL